MSESHDHTDCHDSCSHDDDAPRISFEPDQLDTTPVEPEQVLESFQLLEHLSSQLPEEIRNKPKDEAVQALLHIFNSFRRHTQMNDKYSEMHKSYKQIIKSKYQFKHPQLLDLNKWEFEEEFKQAIESNDPTKILNALNQEDPYVYTVPMLKPSFCKLFIEEVDHFSQWCQDHGFQINRPNSMNNYGAILDDFGFDEVLDQFMLHYVNPMSKIIFPAISDKLDRHHGFIVEYQVGKDTKLDFHVDDSEVTINLCLGETFTGGDLYFGGIRCSHHQQTAPLEGEEFLIDHTAGQALIHYGHHRHAATPIKTGRRMNLILWCRASSLRTMENLVQCPSWCAMHDSSS